MIVPAFFMQQLTLGLALWRLDVEAISSFLRIISNAGLKLQFKQQENQ